MPFYFDQDADRLGLSSKDLESVNDALRKARRVANPVELQGNARTWYGRVFRLSKAIDELPDRFNAFRNAGSVANATRFQIVKLLRVEPPYVRVQIQRVDHEVSDIVSLPLLSLEKAVARLVDTHETGILHDNRSSTRHRLTSENTEALLDQYCPSV